MKRAYKLKFRGKGWSKYLRCVGNRGIGKNRLAGNLNAWLANQPTRYYMRIIDYPGGDVEAILFERVATNPATGQTLLEVT